MTTGKIFWLAFTGDYASEISGCIVEVEHFTSERAFNRRMAQIERRHEADHDAVESWTFGEITPAMIKRAARAKR